MKRIVRTVGILLMCGAFLMPTAEGRGRNDNTPVKSSPAQTRPSVSRPAQQQASRPVSQSQGSPTARPGNMGQGSSTGRPSGTTTRPGTTGQGMPSTRPGNSGQGPSGNNSRPGGSQGGNYGGAPGGPIGSSRPDYRPTPPPPGLGRPGGGPARPNMPPAPPSWYRPAPPPSWRPPRHWRPFNSILGIAFGTTINLSINALINSGYAVSQYGANTVYVNNVPMLGLMWPDAVLYYNNVGGLCGSRFIYGTGFYDMTRYNTVYTSLLGTYGAPYSVQNTASGIEANWWGTGSQFITLSFAPQYNTAGAVVYYTTLSFGN